jgi:hypothetical protein
MGIIPWLMMMRLRMRQAQEKGSNEGTKEADRMQRQRLEMSEFMRKQRDNYSRPSYDPVRNVNQIFGN